MSAPCVDDVGRSKAEGVYRGVGHAYRTDQIGIDSGLDAACLLRGDDVCADARLAARLYESGLIVEVVLRQCDEETVGLIDAVARYLAQRHVFLNTFLGRLAIRHGIACSAMQQTVVASCGSIGEVILLDEQHAQASHRAVSCCAGSCNAAADDDDIILLFLVSIHCRVV